MNEAKNPRQHPILLICNKTKHVNLVSNATVGIDRCNLGWR